MLNRHWGMGLVFVLALMAGGCAATSINQVLADPGKYRNDTITVRGTVTDSASVLGKGAYRIADGDQGLWVITNGGAPRKGARVNVTGRVQEGYDVGGLGRVINLPSSLQSGVVLIESSHKARD
jgi:type 1 fimbria pilin